MFGTGGAARAIGVELAFAGAKSIRIVDRGERRGKALARLLNERPQNSNTWKGDYAAPKEADIIVNATSIGMLPNVDARLDLDARYLRPGQVVADVIANPARTRLLADAEAQDASRSMA
jgi:shikimate dehydrogenase